MIVRLDTYYTPVEGEVSFNVLCDECREKETVEVCSCAPQKNIERYVANSLNWHPVTINQTGRCFCGKECALKWVTKEMFSDE